MHMFEYEVWQDVCHRQLVSRAEVSSMTFCQLPGVSIAAWCEGCENDSKRRKGSLIVGQPVMVAPSIYHQHPSMYYQQQQPPSNQQQSMEYHVGQAPMYQTAYQPAY